LELLKNKDWKFKNCCKKLGLEQQKMLGGLLVYPEKSWFNRQKWRDSPAKVQMLTFTG
jgi:hypothetical protein